MESIFSRTEMLLGADGMACLRNARVAVFGLGGVGSFAAESLARCGVGSLVLIDGDSVAPSNLNRQLFATRSTVGKTKVCAAAERIFSVTHRCNLIISDEFIRRDSEFFYLAGCDFCIDAIDDVPAKVAICLACDALGVAHAAAMGCGNRLDPSRLRVTDIFSTSGDPLCRKMRGELRKAGVQSLPVVFSDEQPIVPPPVADESGILRRLPGSAPFVPPAAGLLLASLAVRSILSKELV